jgi:hypothetical protein
VTAAPLGYASDDEAAFIDPRAAAIRMGVSASTLAKWRMSGDGPGYVKLGRRVLYSKAVLAKFIASRALPNTSADHARRD